MGCSCDRINMHLKTKEMATIAINFFAELLKEDLEGSFFDVDEIEIEEKDDGFWLSFEEEPLFNTWEAGDQIDYFVKEFIKKYPNEYFYLNDTESFNNCGDTNYYEFKYNEKLKELTLRRIYSEWGDGLFDCPECEEHFDDGLMFIEDYEDNKTYTCPNCNAEIKFDAEEIIEKIKLEDL